MKLSDSEIPKPKMTLDMLMRFSSLIVLISIVSLVLGLIFRYLFDSYILGDAIIFGGMALIILLLFYRESEID